MADGGARHGSEVDSITRRQALRQGALIGTAVVWSTPLVQAVTISPAAAQSTSPPATTTTSSTSTSTTTSTTSTSTTSTSTTTTTTPENLKEISNVQIIVGKDGLLYGLKWDIRWEAWSSSAPDTNDCIRFFGDASQVMRSAAVAAQFEAWVPVVVIDAFHWQVLLPLPSGYELVAGWSKAGDARQVGCEPAVIGATSADFYGVPQ